MMGVVAAIDRNFSAYELFMVDDSDMLIVATNRSSGLEPEGWSAVPTPDIPRHRDLIVSAALRLSPPGVDLARVDPRLPEAVERKRRVQALFLSGQPPADWRAWVFEALRAEHEWHLGTAGVVDEGFYRLLCGYLARARAGDKPRTPWSSSTTWRCGIWTPRRSERTR